MPFIDPAQAATSSDPTSGLAEFFLSQGILGALCVALLYIVFLLWKELRDERLKHETAIAAKEKLINELQDERLKEAREGYAFAKSIQTTLDAFLVAMRHGSRA